MGQTHSRPLCLVRIPLLVIQDGAKGQKARLKHFEQQENNVDHDPSSGRHCARQLLAKRGGV